MSTSSPVLAALNNEERRALENRLLQRQSGKCFICDKVLDLVLHAGQLDVDHIEPLSRGGRDEENNFAITHLSCNRSKGASDLRVARRMAEFEQRAGGGRARCQSRTCAEAIWRSQSKPQTQAVS